MNQHDKPQKSNKNAASPLKYAGLVSAIGIDLAACTLGGFYLGSWLDKIWGGPGLWIAFGVLLGLAIGGVSVFMITKAVMGESDE
ncbi:AtpZ/AtpI family protein [Paenibacillus sp. Y412MC10]|uniref:AtpZ/AtpI family protein n=1 Tax=Geobacillus sp. (strain Y412MC10) TaxID=481743 RepID=UPI0011A00B01|nr:AtpZ/AtpI family protein [Paenibacillus sp. Y412MC10]